MPMKLLLRLTRPEEPTRFEGPEGSPILGQLCSVALPSIRTTVSSDRVALRESTNQTNAAIARELVSARCGGHVLNTRPCAVEYDDLVVVSASVNLAGYELP